MKLSIKTLNIIGLISITATNADAAALSYSNDFTGVIGGTIIGDGLWGGAGVDDAAGQPGGADGDEWAFFQTGTDAGGTPASASAGVVFALGQPALLADGDQITFSFDLGAKTGQIYDQSNGVSLQFFDGDPEVVGTQVGSTFTYTPNYDEAFGGGAGTVVDSVVGNITLTGDTVDQLYARFFFDGSTNDTSFKQGLLDNLVIRQTQVPEPSSTALLGLAGLALILRRRK